jgi:hypothetical protein
MAERVHSLESLLVHGLRALVDDGALSLSGWLAVLNGIVEAAQLFADAPTAAAAYDLLLPYAFRPRVSPASPPCGSVVPRSDEPGHPNDSRRFGFVPAEAVLGVVVFRSRRSQ